MPTTSNFGWTTPADTDLVKDGAAAIRTLGNGVDTSFVDLKGGTTGQVLAKASGSDLDFSWVTTDDANAIQNAIVDAKGDLIAASAADTPARLAVGSNGETLVADSSASTGLRWQANQAAGRNTCINGGMDIWQRGTSFVPTNGATTLGPDRWVMYRNGGTGSTVSRQTSGLTNFLYSCRVQRDSGNTSTNAIYIWQNWESQSTYQLAGKTIVISYYARAGANYSPTSSLLGVQLFTGTGVDENIWTGYTGQAQPLDATQAITTTWTRYTQVLTLNSNVTEMCLRFLMTPTGTASTNDWFEVTGIQVELGNVPTTFTRAGGTLAGEYLACARYYQKSYDLATAPGTDTNTGLAYSAWSSGGATTGYLSYEINYPVRMRTAATVTTYDVADASGKVTRTTPGVGDQNNITPATAFSSESRILIQSSTGNSHTGLALHWTASAEL